MGTEIYFMSAHEAEERNRTADDRNRRELTDLLFTNAHTKQFIRSFATKGANNAQ